MRPRAVSVVFALVAGLSVSAWCAPFPLTVILVRHAEKATTPPDDPVLSDLGNRRAKALNAMLASVAVTAVYASEAARTQLTVKPLADRLHLEINHKFLAAQPQELAQAILNGKDRVALVAGHSNRVPQIIQALGGGPVPPIEDAWEFDNLYVVTIFAPGKASTVRLHYGEPSTPGAATLVLGGGQIMRITVGRSGGVVAAPGLTIEATLDLPEGHARVTEAASSYAHDLSAEDARKVRGMVDATRFFQLPGELRSLNESASKSGRTSIADQWQYDITVHSDDGREHSVTVSDTMTDELERLSPGLGKFLGWMKQEFDSIMRYRLQQN
jgi:phosphohistidine phosphatase SixA